MTEYKGTILLHPVYPSPIMITEIPRFDVFVKKEFLKEFEYLKDCLYEADCKYAKKYGEKYRDEVYLGSEDLIHSFGINVEIIRLIVELASKGFRIVSYYEEEKK